MDTIACLYMDIIQLIMGIICRDGVKTMRTFKIPSVPPATMKCVRFPNDVIEEEEALIVGKDCTFSAFVVEAVRVAVEAVRTEGKKD